MARTAPVPNIPAIPGMNPGVFIMGGGGAGGGGSGKGGNGSGGGQGASGENGGDGAGPDGNGAGACGQGEGGGCPNPSHGGNGGTTAGDPVDALTGRVFTTPSVDLALPGPLPLVIRRYYSSNAFMRDVGLGFGWSHSLAWEVEVRRRRVRLWKEDGKREDLPKIEPGQFAIAGGYLVRRSGSTEYEVIDQQRRVRVLREVVPNSRRYLLVQIYDAYGNQIQLSHDPQGRLSNITDSAGRSIRVARFHDGHIAAFEVLNAPSRGRWVPFFRYQQDDDGDLVAATDPRGGTTRYRYDDHLLIAEESPSGRTAHYVYDVARRCVETWVDYPGHHDPSLDRNVPERLADGVTRAKGVLHCKITRDDEYVEVVTSREVRRYWRNSMGRCDKAVLGGGVSTNQYDRWGNLIAHEDPLGNRWSWQRDELGRILVEIDPLGASFSTVYDEDGFVAARSDPQGRTLSYARNPQGKVVALSDNHGPLTEHRYDDRGLWTSSTLPDGAVTQMTYDAMGNRTSVTEPNGGVRQIRYDYFGRITSSVDEKGHETRYGYDANFNLTAIHQPNGTTIALSYDADNQLTTITTGAGRHYKLRRAGYRSVYELERPDGSRVAYRYDREGALVRVVNELGEEHVIGRDTLGRVTEEQTFDGRRLSYQLDYLGRITRVRSSSGRDVEIEYDPLGRILRRTFDQAIVETFEYDSLGRLVRSTDGTVECQFDWDLRSQLVREIQIVGEESHTLDYRYDTCGRRTGMRTSLGHEEEIAFDDMGLPRTVSLGGGKQLGFQWDLMGAELERRLPGGGCIRHGYGALGELVRRQVVIAGAPEADPSEPEWLGHQQGVVLHQSYDRDADDYITTEVSSDRGTVEFAYDALARIVAKIPPHAQRQIFSYDAGDNLFDGVRSYAAGGRLETADRARYVYDVDHQLVEKHVRGSPDDAVWRYRWDERGMLRAVDKPDGRRVENVYDSFARLVARRVVGSDGATVAISRFVWSGDVAVHEIVRRLDRPDDPIVEERTYAYLPSSLRPLAHKTTDVRDESREESPWLYYLNDSAQRPEALVDGQGQLVERLSTQVWGSVSPSAATPLRFAGHREDDETGLFYNRYRHYDPEVGRYISPEPLGLHGGLRSFGYAENNPLAFIDPDGLVGMCSTAEGGGASATRGSAGTPPENTRGAPEFNNLHPAVQRALLPPGQSLEHARGGMRHPASCAEPRAVSDYLRQRGVPDDANDEQISAALQDMQIGANQADNDRARAPCRNCSQFYARMMALYGAPNPSNIAPGYRSAQGNGQQTNFSPPGQAAGYHQSYAAALEQHQADRAAGRPA